MVFIDLYWIYLPTGRIKVKILILDLHGLIVHLRPVK